MSLLVDSDRLLLRLTAKQLSDYLLNFEASNSQMAELYFERMTLNS